MFIEDEPTFTLAKAAPTVPKVKNLYQILERAAASEAGIKIYAAGEETYTRVSYEKLLKSAESDALKISSITDITKDTVILLHFDNHSDNIRWFWACIAAGLVPAMSPPMTADLKKRKAHLDHLFNLLKDPIVLTSERLLGDFSECEQLRINTVEALPKASGKYLTLAEALGSISQTDETAALMLTSGSTGNAKAVCLRHGQIVAAMEGKTSHLDVTRDDIFLNWINMDHVANLTQIHLQAMYAKAEQIHVPAADLLVDPSRFLRLIDEHRVSYSFAPNFFLGSLITTLTKETFPTSTQKYDFSCLRHLLTGGEANPMDTCFAFTELMQRYNASDSFLSPGFGMTETCAGCVHSSGVPVSQLGASGGFASLGRAMYGVELRTVNADGVRLGVGEFGELQLHGRSVFPGYFNNETATKLAFTDDGWFRSGDRGAIDANGCLILGGRDKDTVIVNGVKYSPTDLEKAIADAALPGVVPAHTVVFAHRPAGSNTEVICVVYLPSYADEDLKSRAETNKAIGEISARLFGVSVHEILPVEKENLPKTSLGKISRNKVRTDYENGVFAELSRKNIESIRAYNSSRRKAPQTETEVTVCQLIADMFEMDFEEVGLDSSIFDLGVNSIALINFLYQLQGRLGLKDTISLSLALTNPSVGAMAAALDNLSAQALEGYNPVVPLQVKGDKTPLWLVHPGVGEILVFLNLAKTFTDRPIYALRAKGFNAGDDVFGSLEEVISTYYEHIKKTQPKGPYAIAGYSFGAMLVFEVVKRLEANGDKVKFFGSFNLPPHIKERMRQLDFIEVVSHLSYFLGLISEEHSTKVTPMLHQYSRRQVLDYLIEVAPPKRLQELGMDQQKLEKWASVAAALQNLAIDYEPSGVVSAIDIFVAIPLAGVAKNKQDWIDNKLSKWSDFSWSDPVIHDVDGAHYTMMDSEHVHSFQKKLKDALAARGI